MADIKKLDSTIFMKRMSDAIFQRLPLPKIHPDIISTFSVIMSVVFLFNSDLGYQVVVLFIVFLFDTFDGAIARKYHFRKSPEEEACGWMVDVTLDRLSEGIIAIAFFIPLFPLFILNTFLVLWSYKKNFHIILPLRQVLLVYLVIKLVF